jgi:hypothetical protein
MESFVKHVMLYHVVPIVCMNRFSIIIISVAQYVNLLKLLHMPTLIFTKSENLFSSICHVVLMVAMNLSII